MFALISSSTSHSLITFIVIRFVYPFVTSFPFATSEKGLVANDIFHNLLNLVGKRDKSSLPFWIKFYHICKTFFKVELAMKDRFALNFVCFVLTCLTIAIWTSQEDVNHQWTLFCYSCDAHCHCDAHHRDCDQKDIEEALLCCCSERERVVVALSARCFKQQKIPQTVHFNVCCRHSPYTYSVTKQ